MRVDLHNHTIYCNHATGSMEEYIQVACERGINIFGFSCHAPMEFDKKYRMDSHAMPIYFDNINTLRKLYHQQQSKIEILSALEVDYILGREDLLLPEVLNAEVDYLIGSVHFLGNWGFDNPEFIGEWESYGVEQTWNHYLDSIQAMAKTRYFQIVGHLDLPKLFGNHIPNNLLGKMQETLQILYDNNMVLEVNAAGLRKAVKEPYPNTTILKMAKEIGLDITLSSDAHSLEQIGFGYETCLKLIKEIGFKKVVIFRKKQKYFIDLE